MPETRLPLLPCRRPTVSGPIHSRSHRNGPAAALLAVVCTLALGCGSADPPAARHAILITADTWRADHFGGRRGGVPLTPGLDARAVRALRFADASSGAASTAPGVASLLSGLAPHRSGVQLNEHPLPPTFDTLATLLHAEGFETAAFVSNPVLRRGRGFERGFGHYERVAPTGDRKKARAEAVNERVLAWLDAAPRDARLFLWVHYMEPHGPYTPTDALRSLFDLAAFDAEQEVPLQPEGRNGGRGAIPFYQQHGAPRPADAGDARDYLRRYAAEVRALDAAASALLAALDARGLLARAAWVITSDHGEALADDHGYWFAHDTGVTRDQIRVPLLLVHPRSQAARIDAPVATVDVLPTLLSLLDVAVPPGLDGVSLLAAPPDGRALFARSRRERMVRSGRFKLRVAGDRRVLHDLAADPDERSDLAARHPEVLAELDALLPDAGAPD